MSRGHLPRAYLRIDPNIDQVYPELRKTFVGLLCAAHRQPERGRFRDRALVEALCGKAFVKQAYTRGDLTDLEDGRPYVTGWDEWQEGDLTVAERMRRVRDRREKKRDRVTKTASHASNDVTTDAVPKDSVGSSAGVGVGDSPPTPAAKRQGLRGSGTSPRELAKAEIEAERERAREARLERTRNLNPELRAHLMAQEGVTS